MRVAADVLKNPMPGDGTRIFEDHEFLITGRTADSVYYLYRGKPEECSLENWIANAEDDEVLHVAQS